MKRIRLTAIILAGALTVGALGAVAALAAQGDKDDPLVTLSYLTQVVDPKLDQAVDTAVEKNAQELKRQLELAITSYENRVDEKLSAAGTASFAAKSLAQGDKLTLPAGREILVVEGSLTAVGTLTDTTAGAVVRSGESLASGHLYVTAEDDSGVQAAAAGSVMTR